MVQKNIAEDNTRAIYELQTETILDYDDQPFYSLSFTFEVIHFLKYKFEN